jgi:hypothetical protein
MRFYRETTAWDGNVPNHIYLLSTDKSKMFGYMKAGTQETAVFKKPYRFDARYRTFQEVLELGEIDMDNLSQPAVQNWEFIGSKGDKYIVQKIDNMLQCSCPGFTYRGDCKHVKEVGSQ